jgi:hypothetical protein
MEPEDTGHRLAVLHFRKPSMRDAIFLVTSLIDNDLAAPGHFARGQTYAQALSFEPFSSFRARRRGIHWRRYFTWKVVVRVRRGQSVPKTEQSPGEFQDDTRVRSCHSLLRWSLLRPPKVRSVNRIGSKQQLKAHRRFGGREHGHNSVIRSSETFFRLYQANH